jgi:hypothetical protein
LKIKTAEDKAARAEQKLIDLAVSHDKIMKEKAEEVCLCVGLSCACLLPAVYLEYLE